MLKVVTYFSIIKTVKRVSIILWKRGKITIKALENRNNFWRELQRLCIWVFICQYGKVCFDIWSWRYIKFDEFWHWASRGVARLLQTKHLKYFHVKVFIFENVIPQMPLWLIYQTHAFWSFFWSIKYTQWKINTC